MTDTAPEVRRTPPAQRARWLRTRGARWGIWILLALPLLMLFNDVRLELVEPGSRLGPDPGEALVDYLGTWGLRILYLTLLVSSLARLLNVPLLIQHRRKFGVWAFTYVVLHFMSYFGILAGLDFQQVLGDVTKRPYIIFGFFALVLLLPLAITSTRGWQRRLGVNWRRLHKLVYLIAILAWVHLFIQEKATYVESFIYGLILVALFAERIIGWYLKAREKRASSTG